MNITLTIILFLTQIVHTNSLDRLINQQANKTILVTPKQSEIKVSRIRQKIPLTFEFKNTSDTTYEITFKNKIDFNYGLLIPFCAQITDEDYGLSISGSFPDRVIRVDKKDCDEYYSIIIPAQSTADVTSVFSCASIDKRNKKVFRRKRNMEIMFYYRFMKLALFSECSDENIDVPSVSWGFKTDKIKVYLK